MDLPVKRAHTKVTGRIDCLVCTSKDFSSLTQYKQHLVRQLASGFYEIAAYDNDYLLKLRYVGPSIAD